MAEEVSDTEETFVKRPLKRRQIIDPSTIVPVPIYSNKVNSCLHLEMGAPVFTRENTADSAIDDSLWLQFSSCDSKAKVQTLSDLEDDEVELLDTGTSCLETRKELKAGGSPSPPPPQSPVRKQSRRVKQKLNEINRKLEAVNTLLSPEAEGGRRPRRCRRQRPKQQESDDVIIIEPECGSLDSPCNSSVREFPLKIRCRTTIHKLPVLTTTRLGDIMTQLSVILKVPISHLLLLREAVELPTDSTISELGLGIADIIDCVVIATEEEGGVISNRNNINLRLQSKDRSSSKTFSLHREAALSSIFSKYMSSMPTNAQKNICFQFDGSKVIGSQTPAQLGMEDGDIIEVWN